MLEEANQHGLTVPSNWWAERQTTASDIYSLYTAAKRRIGAMECRVAPFEDDLKGVRSTVAEAYVHVHLGTQYNDFSTS